METRRVRVQGSAAPTQLCTLPGGWAAATGQSKGVQDCSRPQAPAGELHPATLSRETPLPLLQGQEAHRDHPGGVQEPWEGPGRRLQHGLVAGAAGRARAPLPPAVDAVARSHHL